MTCIISSFHYLENTCPNPPLFSRGKAPGRVTPDEDHTASRDLGYKSGLAGSRSLFFPYLRYVRREILGMAYFGGLWGGPSVSFAENGFITELFRSHAFQKPNYASSFLLFMFRSSSGKGVLNTKGFRENEVQQLISQKRN